jgi:hypothetical protein
MSPLLLSLEQELQKRETETHEMTAVKYERLFPFVFLFSLLCFCPFRNKLCSVTYLLS